MNIDDELTLRLREINKPYSQLHIDAANEIARLRIALIEAKNTIESQRAYIDKLDNKCTALEGQVELAEMDRDGAQSVIKPLLKRKHDDQEEIARLRDALTPFAWMVLDKDDTLDSNRIISVFIRDCVRAKLALDGIKT